ncbi:MAG: 4Fe-4S cluster-binding domain-containing protein, partial [Oscillospiraceae bacterium]|nr:4Fe-4S cluster-binding domain-containing protein [Oscillospiraceae bacterium]
MQASEKVMSFPKLVHTFSKRGVWYIIDTNSGAVHISDEQTAAVVCAVSEGAELPDTVRESSTLVDSLSVAFDLCGKGLLFSEDALGEQSNIYTPVSPLKAMCFHAANGCNLVCKYCFAEEQNADNTLMSLDTAKRGIDFFLANSGKRKTLELDFFGGEPLLNWDTVTETVKYAREKGAALGKTFDFTLTTNGVLLDDTKIDFINREMSNIVLSLDGRREVHDN